MGSCMPAFVCRLMAVSRRQSLSRARAGRSQGLVTLSEVGRCLVFSMHVTAYLCVLQGTASALSGCALIESVLRMCVGEPTVLFSRSPTSAAPVAVHYVGTLDSDGSQFDSSRDRDDPFTFTLGQGRCTGVGWGGRGLGVVMSSDAERTKRMGSWAHGQVLLLHARLASFHPPRPQGWLHAACAAPARTPTAAPPHPSPRSQHPTVQPLKQSSPTPSTHTHTHTPPTSASPPLLPTPDSTPAGQVIKGWDLGVASMKKGEKAVLKCTAPYAYGEAGSPPKIPPGATLNFEVSGREVRGGQGCCRLPELPRAPHLPHWLRPGWVCAGGAAVLAEHQGHCG